jgi:type II secretory pathway component PulF
MPRFYARYVSRNGRQRTAKRDAVDLESLAAQIENQFGSYVVDIRRLRDTRGSLARTRISSRTLLSALESLELMLATGVRINTAVRKIAECASEGAARRLWTNIVLVVEETGSLGVALKCFPKVFNEPIIGVIMAHEAAGSLAEGIKTVRNYVAQMYEIRRESMRGAAYPAFVCAMGVVVSAILCAFTLPRFSRMLADIGVTKTNLLTQFFFLLSNFVIGNPGYSALVLCLPFVAVWLVLRPRLKPAVDHIVLRLPILRDAIEALVMARVCVTFRALSQSGVRVVDALETCADAAGNAVFSGGICRVVAAVRENMSVGTGFERAGVFSPEVVLAVKSGEGCLPDVFGRLAEFYREESRHRVAMALRLLEPLLLVFVLVWVFGIALAVILPVIDIINGIH